MIPSRIRSWRGDLLVVLLAFLIFGPMFYHMVYQTKNNDFGMHTLWARQMVEEPEKVPAYVKAHSGFQLLVMAAHTLTPTSWKRAAFGVTLPTALLSAWLIFRYLKRRNASLWMAAAALGVLLAGPLILLAPLDGLFYLGYIGMNTYHNPTILLLKPLALVQFMLSLRALEDTPCSWREVAGAALVCALATFVKPSFAVCLLPALGVLALARLFRRQRIDWWMLVLGVGLPSVIFLAWQYFLSYGSGEEGEIIFLPLGLMKAYSGYLLPKFLFSLPFPVLLAGLDWKRARVDRGLQVAWLSFLAGAFLTYFMAENGGRFMHGNFAWSGEIAMFILFFASSLYWVERRLLQETRGRGWILLTAWGLQVAAGVVYYFFCLLSESYL